MSDVMGAMRARISLQRPTRAADEIGGAAISWSDEGVVWAEIVVRGGSTASAFDTAVATASFSAAINRRTDVRVGWRVIWGDRVLRVIGVADDGAPRMTLSCEEERI